MKILILCLLFISACSHHSKRTPSSLEIIEGEGMVGDHPYWYVRPAGFDGRKLPVVYFLHGRGGNRHMFRDIKGKNFYQSYIEGGGKPFAIVALTGTFNRKDTYWLNENRENIIKKVIPEIEKTHNLGGMNNRMVAGISMGSHGALQLGLTTGMFKCSASHSLVVRSYESMMKEFPGIYKRRKDFSRTDPLTLLQWMRSKKESLVQRLWVDIGGSDSAYFMERAKLIESQLNRLAFNPDFIDIGRSYPQGAHDNKYWQARMPEYLEWYGECFL